ncbi:MAG: hypothetical protein QOI42_852 [Frankiaceae bacterium]|nr:hypothetical protein [Frankiaceae bacterium]
MPGAESSRTARCWGTGHPALDPERAKAETLDLADVGKSIRQHWRVAVAMLPLAGLVLAIFLVTRNQVRAPNRYLVNVQLLVPTRDKDGKRPASVPPSLMQGQSTVAQSTAVREKTLKAAKVPKDRRGGIQFSFSTSDTGDVITLGATARDADVARAVALAFKSAYVSTRATTYASSQKSAAAGAKTSLTRLTAELEQVKKDLKAIDANLLATLPDSASGSSVDVVGHLPSTTPIPTVLLVSEHPELLARISNARKAFATPTTAAITPSSFATTLEVFSAVNVTPPLSSPVLPAAAILGLGLALALGLPVLIDRLDKSIRTAKTAAVSFDSPVLTSVPPASRRVQRSLAAPGTPWDGAYRALAATSIATDRLPTAIVVTSPTGIVQDTVAANFAAALAGLGLRVALIATDPRQAWFSDTGEPAEPGLGFPDLLELAHQGRLDGTLPRGLLPTRVGNLRVLPPGPRGREFSLDGFRPLLEALSTSGVDVTVIAAPALLEDPNATILAWITRSVLWAFETGDVTEAEAKEAAARLALAGASSFGVAMVNDKT